MVRDAKQAVVLAARIARLPERDGYWWAWTALMWILEISGERAAVTLRVAPGTTKTLGRAPRADFVIDAPLISRVHCRLEAREDTLDVVDLSSTNGTYVNDARVEHATLRAGDRLRVGRLEFLIGRAAEPEQ